MEKVEPRYDFATRLITVELPGSGIEVAYTIEQAEALHASLRVGLYEASLYDSYEKKRDKMKKDKGEIPVDNP